MFTSDEWEEISYLIGIHDAVYEVAALYRDGAPETWTDPGSDPECEIQAIADEDGNPVTISDPDTLRDIEDALVWRHKRELAHPPCRCADHCRC